MKEIILEMIQINSHIIECQNNKNYSNLKGEIERWQTLVNRLEAKLRDYKDMEYNEDKIRDIKKELKELRKEKKRVENV